MKTLYVTDLDGTLLNKEDRINQYSIETINRLVAKGMLFTYATARSLVSASVVTKGLSTDIPVIAYNGCLIAYPLTGEVIASISFTQNELNRAISIIKNSNISPLVYSYIDGVEKVSWISEKENGGIKRYLSLRKGDKRLNPVKSEDALYVGNIFYFTCIGEKEQLVPIFNAFKTDEHYNCTIQQELYSEDFWCEIMPRSATKANAIQKLKNRWECSRVVSFGDAINDISMFKASDECFAVENAVCELKQLATGIIESNNENGVAKWLEQNVKL